MTLRSGGAKPATCVACGGLTCDRCSCATQLVCPTHDKVATIAAELETAKRVQRLIADLAVSEIAKARELLTEFSALYDPSEGPEPDDSRWDKLIGAVNAFLGRAP